MNLPSNTTFRRVGVTAAAFALLSPLQGQSVFSTDFEGPAYTPGQLVSDPDWSFYSVELDVQVSDLDYASGLQSLSLTGAGCPASGALAGL